MNRPFVFQLIGVHIGNREKPYAPPYAPAEIPGSAQNGNTGKMTNPISQSVKFII